MGSEFKVAHVSDAQPLPFQPIHLDLLPKKPTSWSLPQSSAQLASVCPSQNVKLLFVSPRECNFHETLEGPRSFWHQGMLGTSLFSSQVALWVLSAPCYRCWLSACFLSCYRPCHPHHCLKLPSPSFAFRWDTASLPFFAIPEWGHLRIAC